VMFACVTAWAADRVQVPVWTDGGEALNIETLSASVDGAPSKIVSVRTPSDDLMLLVVLDLTDDLAAVEQARTALLRRLDSMSPNQYVGVLSSQNGLRVLTEPTADRDIAALAIRSQQVGGRAGLLETIEQAADMGTAIIRKSGVRLAILYLTDSDVNNYREALNNPTINQSDNGDVSRRADSLVRERISRMAASLGGAQVPVFISHLAYRTDSLNIAYQTGLIALASATGGSTAVARSNAEIPAVVNSALDRILGHYSVTVELSKSAKKVAVTLANEAGGSLDYRSSYIIGN
jgi:hypothetical protein